MDAIHMHRVAHRYIDVVIKYAYLRPPYQTY